MHGDSVEEMITNSVEANKEYVKETIQHVMKGNDSLGRFLNEDVLQIEETRTLMNSEQGGQRFIVTEYELLLSAQGAHVVLDTNGDITGWASKQSRTRSLTGEVEEFVKTELFDYLKQTSEALDRTDNAPRRTGADADPVEKSGPQPFIWEVDE